MSTYQVIARRWRPKQFSELVGQDHVVKTLGNSIEIDRIAHAYLFVGPRGTGKTTSARLFAKSLNWEDGPSLDVPEDSEIGILVLGASTDKKGPGPIVTQLSKNAGSLPIPITVVPGDLSKERLEAIT